MKLKAVSGIMLTLLLIGMLTFAFNIQPVKASGTIYIRADGSVDPPTAPIQRDGNVYTFTANIDDYIVVQRDNIVVDGAGYTLQGTGFGKGIDLSYRSNVTIRDMEISAYNYGILLFSSSNNNIYRNKITAINYYGIRLEYSSNNTVSENNITNNNYYGIVLYYSSNNIISQNNIGDNEYGIHLFYYSLNNSIYHNNFVNNTYQVQTSDSVNVWDNGYPSGGNCWSDYNGTDFYSGSHQNLTGSDGIGDTTYVIDENNADVYPIMRWTNIVVLNVTPSKTVVGQGFTLQICMTVQNEGWNTETFNLTVYANAMIIATLTSVTLTSRNLTTITFAWNTTGVPYGNYTISAYAHPVPGETYTTDNTYTDGWVLVTGIGDVNGDMVVNVLDIILVLINLGPVPPKPPECDVNCDNQINVLDLLLVKLNLGPV